jgi:hypothetical protein
MSVAAGKSRWKTGATRSAITWVSSITHGKPTILVRNKSFGALTGLLSNFRIRCVYIQKDDMASLCFCFCLMEVVFGQAVRINEHGGTVGPAVRMATGLEHDPNRRHPFLPASNAMDSSAAPPAMTRRDRRILRFAELTRRSTQP